MLLPRFEYHDPRDLDEACRLMGDLGKEARPLAGGTDLLVNMKKRVLSPKHLVSLGGIEELHMMGGSNGGYRIGACMTSSEVAQSSAIREHFPALCEGAFRLGSPLIRNLATVAGNLVSARPAADLPPPLMAYGASVTLRSPSGERSIPLDEFFKGPGATMAEPTEIMESVHLALPPAQSGAAYLKLGIRQTLEISIVNVAAFLALDGDRIQSARVVLGSVAPMPIRAPSAEKALAGRKPSAELFAEAAQEAARDARPIDDFRASADYRRDMVAVLARRVLETALERARA